MEIIFYSTTNENNVVYKTLADELRFENCTLKEPTDIINPTIIINSNINFKKYNYCYIPEFNRYYFITDIVSRINNMWILKCKVDVLMSFKEFFANINVIVNRGESNINPYIIDNNNVVQNNESVHTYAFPTTPLSKELSYILTTVGGIQ